MKNSVPLTDAENTKEVPNKLVHMNFRETDFSLV